MATFTSKFAIGDKVIIDDDPHIVARVVLVQFDYSATPYYEVSWWHNGDVRRAFFYEPRLCLAFAQ